MKALSIRQPWAYAILHLGKRVENREWSGCAYRGPVLLHASSRVVLRPTKREPESFGDAVEKILSIVKPSVGAERIALLASFAALTSGRSFDRETGHARRGCGEPTWRPAPTLPLGGIVGRARIVDAIHVNDQPPDGQWPWYSGGFALVLSDVEPLPFIPWKGSLGFFDVPDDIIEARADYLRIVAEAEARS